ncbi:hypothetical protein [Thalassobacillus sp. CUG 92003]|uniref:hypothetical protein n=1 Tax=Thalassobacillus sp. CUG 92003 TaxID=2736641 RepID=UPI0015E70CD9|nr:hypothetical protein [Thalassobacillus sp. CUG 92003]
MSEKKKVIYVKDLVIKADNVKIEPTHEKRRDPFFGRDHEESRNEVESAAEERKGHESSSGGEGFSWI